MIDQTLSTLIGLCGAINNNGKSENTDRVVRDAILAMALDLQKTALLSPESDAEIANGIKLEKFAISPNCATCEAPCGNTSDYDMSHFYEAESQLREIKKQIIIELGLRLQKEEILPGIALKAISYIGYDLDLDNYNKLLEEVKTDPSNGSQSL